MGQYFNGVCLNKENEIKKIFHFSGKLGTLSENGLLVNNIYTYLIESPSRFVWIGDYSNPIYLTEKDKEVVLRYIKETAKKEFHTCTEEEYIAGMTDNMAKNNINLYNLALMYAYFNEKELSVYCHSEESVNYEYPYLVNLDKEEYVNLWDTTEFMGNNNSVIQFLCADGGDKINGQFDGTYYKGINADLIGRWAYDKITLSKFPPKGYTKIDGRFMHNNDIESVTANLLEWIEIAKKQGIKISDKNIDNLKAIQNALEDCK